VDRVVLMRPGSVTHAFDADQRSIILEASFDNGIATVTAPPDATYAPPGNYMLFLISNNGVPSLATWVTLE
jgi:galactose oxidase-like protein